MSKKQAVLLIHGIGEQRPMDTLRGFVEEVWGKDQSVHNTFVKGYEGKGQKWSMPDNISGSYELRCLTTASNKNKVLTDFYEYYWAHMMEGNKISHVFSWLKRIVFKAPWNLPSPLIGIWAFLILAGLGIIYLLFNNVLPEMAQISEGGSWTPIIIGLVVILFILSIFQNIVGDAARYLDAGPKNIKRRQEIRAKGIAILKKLHESGKYDRIIIVGHSLGTYIAYDILTHAWPDYQNRVPIDTALPNLDEMEKFIRKGTKDLKKFRELQHKVFEEQLANKGTWLVSDLVTLGSPLTYADILMAKDIEELIIKQKERELPSAPPHLDEEGKISYGKSSRRMHQAAVFATTRWTNIYFPPALTLFGDIISGPLQPMFGFGIEDIDTKTKLSGGLVSHTKYWTPEKGDTPADHIVKLRKALNLLNK